jgi:hypothetical protein
MLPEILRKDDPVLGMTLPAETRSELEDLLKALAIFTAARDPERSLTIPVNHRCGTVVGEGK